MSGSLSVDAIAFANALIDLTIAWIVLGRRSNPRVVRLPRICAVGAALALSLGAKLLLLVPGVIIRWEIAWLLWIDLLIVPPILGLRLVCTPRKKRTPAALIVGWALLAIWPICGYANLIGPFDLQTERTTVSVTHARAGSAPLSVAVIADLQTDWVSHHERAAIERVVSERPDLILIPGDLYQGPEDGFADCLGDFRSLLITLAGVAPVVLVGGDHDTSEELHALTEGTPVHWLVDEELDLHLRDRHVKVLGIPNECFQASSAAAVRAFEQSPGEDDLRLLVAHRPGAVQLMRPKTRIDLLVCGHTHGGQVAIPGFGPPVIYTKVPRAVAAGGLHKLEGRALYVSRGVGHEQKPAPRIRLFCPPEISILTFSDDPDAGGF